MNLTDIPEKISQITTRTTEDGELVINSITSHVCMLQGSSEAVWKIIDGKTDVNKIISKVKEEYEGSDKKIKEYVLEALEDLKTAKLITIKQ